MDPNALPDVVSQDFSLMALFLRSDPIVKAVMVILVVASVWSWAVAIDKWFGIMGVRSRARRVEQALQSGHSLEEFDRASDRGGDAMARVLAAGARELREGRRGGGDDAHAVSERARSQMEVAVNRETLRLESGLSTLAIIASSAPFIGL